MIRLAKGLCMTDDEHGKIKNRIVMMHEMQYSHVYWPDFYVLNKFCAQLGAAYRRYKENLIVETPFLFT